MVSGRASWLLWPGRRDVAPLLCQLALPPAFLAAWGRAGCFRRATAVLALDRFPDPADRRVRADIVLDHAAKAIELEDIEVRVRALEEATRTKGSRR